jgi:hypothetical protein
MKSGFLEKRLPFFSLLIAAFVLVSPAPGQAQRGGGAAPASARQSAPMDLTGYWVSVVSEDWALRMITPPKGRFDQLPLNAEGRNVGNAWDPAKDEAAGEQCRSYGAPVIMRIPGRLHVTWENDSTLRIDTDAGTQTRLFRFGPAAATPAGAPTWQGHSVAQWEFGPGGARGSGGAAPSGNLKVVTTNLRPGYVRKNGAPYSKSATVTEYYDIHTLPNGDQRLTVTTIVEDPEYFSRPWVTSSDFKKLPDDTGWNPTPCTVK